MRSISTVLPLFLMLLALPAHSQDVDLNGTWRLDGDEGSRLEFLHDLETGTVASRWLNDDRVDIRGRIEGSRVTGEVSVYFANSEEVCPNDWVQWMPFRAVVSDDGNTLRGAYRGALLGRERCDTIPATWEEAVYHRVLPAAADEDGTAELCPPPNRLAAEVAELERLLAASLVRHDSLPGSAMFRRTSLPFHERSTTGAIRRMTDQVIANRGPDDFLVEAGRPDGAIRSFIAEARSHAMEDGSCDRADWIALAARLEGLKRSLRDRHGRVSRSFATVDNLYLVYGGQIRDILANTRSDHSITANVLRRLGLSDMNAVRGSLAGTTFGIPLAALNKMSGVPAGGLLGWASVLTSAWKVFNAAIDFGDLMRGDRMLPQYLEWAEHHAYLQPLVDHYDALFEQERLIISIIKWHFPVPRSS